MSFQENGGEIVQTEISEKIVTLKFWTIYSSDKRVIFLIQ